MKVRVTTTNTATAASISASQVRGDRVVASQGINSIQTGNGLIGGPIISSGTISANSANTTQAGIVQLNDTFTSNSITQAATANVVNAVYSVANSSLTLANDAYNLANTKLPLIGGTIDGNLTITGNLLVTGNTTTLNVETLDVEDNEIVLNFGATSATLNAGIIVDRADQSNVFLRWNEVEDKWGWSDDGNTFYTFDTALNAYAQANLAYAQANAAYDQANLGYNQANTSYDQANAAYAQANAARDQSNTAYSQANAAYSSANAAANLTSIYANGLLTVSNAGVNFNNTSTINVSVTPTSSGFGNVQFTVNTTSTGTAFIGAIYDTANAAYTQANAAYNQANTAYGQANVARNTANLAYNLANTAANTVQISVNGESTLYSKSLNFVNTNTVSVVLSSNTNNADISFIAAPQTVVLDSYFESGNVTAAATANIANGLYGLIQQNILVTANAYDQANIAYDQANAAYNRANTAWDYANTKLSLSGGTIGGDLSISGNLIITGNTTYQNVETYIVDDPLIYLAANNDTSDLVDIGFMGGHNTSGVYQHSGLIRHAVDGEWYLFTGLAEEGHENNVVDVANTTYATLKANINAQSILLVGNSVATQANLTLAHDQANAAYDQANAAYGQANAAYDAANNAAVRVTANAGASISANVLSFNNTSTILVSVSGSGSNANVSFEAIGLGANLVSTKFVTDGNSNSYSLNSSVANDNNLLVSIDGVIIIPVDDYVVSGNNLTLTFMPPAGLNIETRALI